MEFNQEVKKATDPIYQKISKVMPEIEWSVHAPYIYKINQLKKSLNSNTPVLYKISPDISDSQIKILSEIFLEKKN